MIRLGTANDLSLALAAAKWHAVTIRQSKAGYVRKFRCPDCGGKASEMFCKITCDDIVWWEVEWTSRCGYVFDGTSSDAIGSRFKNVTDERARLVGVIDVSNPPPWRRWEPAKGFRTLEFPTLWQALDASVRDCRMLLRPVPSDSKHTSTQPSRFRNSS
jgi:hypothetical protein